MQRKPFLAGAGALALLAGLLVGCAGTGSQRAVRGSPSPPYSGAPPLLDDGWAVASPQDVGLDACLLDSMTVALRRGEDYPNVHAVLIAKDDRLVYEQYFTGEDRRYRGERREWVTVTFHRDTLHDSRSVGKSVVSALVGIAVGTGAISSLDTPLLDFFPEHAALVTPEKRRITLHHALTMSAGLDWNEDEVPYTDDANHAEQMGELADPAGFVLGRPVADEPGATFSYNTGLPTVLGYVVSRATGQPLGSYAREALFEPLGITDVEWAGQEAWSDIPELQWEGTEPWSRGARPGGGLWMRPRDFAKFGSLYLNQGRWDGRQVIPADWVEESTRKHVAVEGLESAPDEYGENGYGYLWWHDQVRTSGGEFEVHTAVGNGGQRIVLIPALHLLVVVHAGRYNEPDAGWMPERLLLEHILAATRGSR